MRSQHPGPSRPPLLHAHHKSGSERDRFHSLPAPLVRRPFLLAAGVAADEEEGPPASLATGTRATAAAPCGRDRRSIDRQAAPSPAQLPASTRPDHDSIADAFSLPWDAGRRRISRVTLAGRSFGWGKPSLTAARERAERLERSHLTLRQLAPQRSSPSMARAVFLAGIVPAAGRAGEAGGTSNREKTA